MDSPLMRPLSIEIPSAAWLIIALTLTSVSVPALSYFPPQVTLEQHSSNLILTVLPLTEPWVLGVSASMLDCIRKLSLSQYSIKTHYFGFFLARVFILNFIKPLKQLYSGKSDAYIP